MGVDDLLKRLFVATDWRTVVARRTQKSPPGKGGWRMFLSWNRPRLGQLRANGDDAQQAWRSNVTGVVMGPLPICWGVSKTV
jgi:peptide/nickel transport system substrate-binding protein